MKEFFRFLIKAIIRLYYFFFNSWQKWQIYKADQMYITTTYPNFWQTGLKEPVEERVMVDIYVSEHRFNGLKKYKRVVKYL
jgi:hypothetical protein